MSGEKYILVESGYASTRHLGERALVTLDTSGRAHPVTFTNHSVAMDIADHLCDLAEDGRFWKIEPDTYKLQPGFEP